MTEGQKDNIRKWVAALRSGTYQQGRLILHDFIHNRFCCLAVACETAGIRRTRGSGSKAASEYHFGERYPRVDIPGRAWFLGHFGFEYDEPFTYQGHVQELAELNDQRGITLSQVADLLEKRFLK